MKKLKYKIEDTDVRGSVDLRTCKPRDILISVHGKQLTYVSPTESNHYYDHKVMYADKSYGTRTHDGYVFRSKRLESDEDIIKIIHV